METWPVTECCIPHLQQILDTHDLYPLPAYNIKGQLIPPLQYDALLKGATVEAHFTLIHHYIKSMNQHVYITMVHKIQVLCFPAPLPTSPFKCLKSELQMTKANNNKFDHGLYILALFGFY